MNDTVLARLTPAGKAAIATLGLTGPAAWATVRELFRRAIPELPAVGAFLHGRLGEGAGATDEVMVFVRAIAPEPIVEVHCHGGIEVVRLLQRQFEAKGVRTVDSAAWLRRTLSEDHAQAHEVLTRCLTVRTAGIALDYFQGAFARAQMGLEQATDRIERLHSLIGLGRHLSEPWKVTIAGAPNAGKSTLVNALAGYTRSLVSPMPGTTRDLVSTQIALDGWPIELTDTAGLRASPEDALEAEGVSRARQALNDADLVVWLVDGSAAPVLPVEGVSQGLLVVTKLDLPAAWNVAEMAHRISAVTGEGVAELGRAIATALVPVALEPGEAVPITDLSRSVVLDLHSGRAI